MPCPMQDLAATRLLFYSDTLLYGSHNPLCQVNNTHNLAGEGQAG